MRCLVRSSRPYALQAYEPRTLRRGRTAGARALQVEDVVTNVGAFSASVPRVPALRGGVREDRSNDSRGKHQMTTEARRVHRGVSAALLALALVLLATAPVAQADTIYPDNEITGSSFDHRSGTPAGRHRLDRVRERLHAAARPAPDERPADLPRRTRPTPPGIGTPPGSLQQAYQPARQRPRRRCCSVAAVRSRRSRSPRSRSPPAARRPSSSTAAPTSSALLGPRQPARRYTLHARRHDGAGETRSELFREDARRLRQRLPRAGCNDGDARRRPVIAATPTTSS